MLRSRTMVCFSLIGTPSRSSLRPGAAKKCGKESRAPHAPLSAALEGDGRKVSGRVARPLPLQTYNPQCATTASERCSVTRAIRQA